MYRVTWKEVDHNLDLEFEILRVSLSIFKRKQVLSISWAIWAACHKQKKMEALTAVWNNTTYLTTPSEQWVVSEMPVSLRARVSFLLRRRFWDYRSSRLKFLCWLLWLLDVLLAEAVWACLSVCLGFQKKYEAFNGSKIILITCKFRGGQVQDINRASVFICSLWMTDGAGGRCWSLSVWKRHMHMQNFSISVIGKALTCTSANYS